MSLVELGDRETVSLPQEAKSALGLHAGARLDVRVVDGEIILRPVESVPAEDAWAYSEQHLAAVARSRGQRGYRLGPGDVDRLIREAEAAHRGGREYRVTEADLAAMEAAHGGPWPDSAARCPSTARSRSPLISSIRC